MENSNKRINISVNICKITLLTSFFLISLHSFSNESKVYVQSKNFTFQLENVTFKQVFNYIEKNSEFVFVYAGNVIEADKKVSINVNHQTVDQVLNKLFENAPVGYVIDNRQISLKKLAIQSNSLQPNSAQQQKKLVQGFIRDENGESIVGANVVVKGTTIGVTTDLDGLYNLSVPDENSILEISFIGYLKQEIKVGKRNTINVVLKENASSLEEVVVIGYGQQKKSSLVSAINSVTNKELKAPTRNLVNNLAGQISGLIAVQRSGEPGYDNSEFWIRGVSSFKGGTTPLVLVDGVPRSMNDVEPDEIETFTLLKDASATAVYGAEGANGVILITTKRGSVQAARISVRAETSVLQPTRLPQYTNSFDYLTLYNEALTNAGSPGVFSNEVLNKYKDGVDPDLYPNVNWFDLLKDFTTNSRVTLNVRGGTERAKYFVSGAFYTESGLFESNTKEDYNANIGVKRFNLRSNIDFSISKSTLISVDLSGQYLQTNYPGVGTGTLFERMSTIPPHLFPMIYSDGKIAGHPDANSMKVNPYNLLNNSGYAKEWRTFIQSRAGLVQKLDFITKGLSYKASISFDANMIYTMNRAKSVTQYIATGRNDDGALDYRQVVSGSNSLGDASAGNSGEKNIYFENSLNYERIFAERHNVGAMLLYMQKDYQPHNQPLSFRKQGVVGRVSYSFDDRYSFEGNFGYTGSETFAKGFRFGFFPAFGVAWYLSNEKFYSDKMRNVVNKLKFRASAGRSGNDDTGGNRFLYRATMTTNAGGYNVGYIDGASNGNIGNGIVEGQFYAPNIGWETEVKQNYGIELGLFNNRIDLQVDYFNNKRSDILLQRSTVAGAAGFQVMPWQNFGSVNNHGLDASLVLNHTIGNVKLAARGNFTFARNKILEYDEVPPMYPWMQITGNRIGDENRALYISDGFYSYDDFIITGEGINREYKYKENVVQSGLAGDIRPGDLKYKDLNGDGIINSNDAKRGLGHPENPEIVYGFGVSAEWKGIAVNIFFQGVGNTSTVLGQSAGQAFFPFVWGVDQSTVRKEFMNRWQDSDPYNFDVDFPRMREGTHPHNTVASTFWLRDASFLRLKNVEISYNFPFIKKMTGVQAARIYLMGNNLAVWDKIKMWDPEMGNKNAGSSYPLSRTFTLGLDVTF